MRSTIREKGFTMVELLVVIAIIGILASIALISYNRVQDKAKDKAIISEMSQLRTQAQVYYDDNSNDYTGLNEDEDVARIVNKMESQGGSGFSLNADDRNWAAAITLPGEDIYCVDAEGNADITTTDLGSGDTKCTITASE